MKITKMEISNFKAISRVELDLAAFNVIVGTNGSGKSSILQALHWVIQSAKNLKVKTNGDLKKASTLSAQDAIYMPSPDYKHAGHNSEYGNFDGSSQLTLRLVAELDDDKTAEATFWIRAARNEGISVHAPSNKTITSIIRSSEREISAYIPGVAGIPAFEEKRSKIIVHRLAAAGDSNTVLRNILDLLKNSPNTADDNGLSKVEELVAAVMGDFKIRVKFDDDKHSRIDCQFQTGSMIQENASLWRPLELVGIGYLQVIQIFAYLVYFRPVVLLVDEPDAHLHPSVQERLVNVLAEAAREFGTQVILTTHSPSVVRSLPQDAKVIWMRNGDAVHESEASVRNLMGWGLLDRRILFLTEDSDTQMIRALLAQWKELERITAIWPTHGSSNVPGVDSVKELCKLLDNKLSAVVHRDRDFLMENEVEQIRAQFTKGGYFLWPTLNSDLESYWATREVIAAHFCLELAQAEELLHEAVQRESAEDKDIQKRRTKRDAAYHVLNKGGKNPHYGEADVLAEATKHGDQFRILGKSILKAIRAIATERKYPNANRFGLVVPESISGEMAPDLKAILMAADQKL